MSLTPDLGDYEAVRPPDDREKTVRQLNSLLRGEISAAETYRMATEKLAASSDVQAAGAGLVTRLQEDHSRAVSALRERIRELAGEPADSSGAWGVWAKFAQGTANLLSDAAALKVLKEGEEHGMGDYQEAMPAVDITTAELLQNQLIPSQQRHIDLLAELIRAVGKM